MPNPMEEMTEEQKEYEAQKLVYMFDKLSRYGSVRPKRGLPPSTLPLPANRAPAAGIRASVLTPPRIPPPN